MMDWVKDNWQWIVGVSLSLFSFVFGGGALYKYITKHKEAKKQGKYVYEENRRRARSEYEFGELAFKLGKYEKARACFEDSLAAYYKLRRNRTVTVKIESLYSKIMLTYAGQSDYKNCLECMMKAHLRARKSSRDSDAQLIYSRFFFGYMEICHRNTGHEQSFDDWYKKQFRRKLPRIRITIEKP